MSSNLAMPSRRRALRLAGGAAAAVGAVGTTSLLATPEAGAAPLTLEEKRRGKSRRRKRRYAPGRYRRTRVLSRPARHLVNRFSFGITPELTAEVRAAGGHLAWYEQQLATAYDGSANGFRNWWPDLALPPATVFRRQNDMVRHSLEVGYDIGSRTMVRRMQSPRPVLEVMTKFWENHLHVPLTADNVAVFRADYGERIRAGALGRFEDLLRETVLHPAMLMYLGNASSTRTHPNENLGRELLELHTVGIGNHTEEDVKNSARILTGWRVKLYSTWEPYYSAADHWTGPVRVKDFADPNGAADGRDLTVRYLRYLAHHPQTARRIATKLVRVFVSDDVPAALVDRLAAVYLANDTQIKPVLRALVRSREFANAVDRKVRDADEDVVATYRLLGARVTRPKDEFSAANTAFWQAGALGLSPFTWPRPDGQPLDNRSWASPTRVLASISLHWELAGRWPASQIRFTRPVDFLPEPQMRFRDLVDHLSRRILQRPSTEALLKACCRATGYAPKDVVTARSDLFRGKWQRLITTFLDSPAFFQH